METSLEDLFVWSDYTWCYREELEQMAHMSDDFRIIYVDTQEYEEFWNSYLEELL